MVKECGPGQFYRKSYTRKTRSGKSVRVAGKCLRSQTRYASPLKADRRRFRGFRKSKRSLKTCPAGFIKRASFVRYTKKGKHSLVPEQCIRNVGAPGKGYAGPGSGIGALRKGELAVFGYANVLNMSVADRHAALAKAVDAYGSLGVWRKLNAVSVYTRRVSPAASRVFKADMDWVRAKYGIKAF